MVVAGVGQQNANTVAEAGQRDANKDPQSSKGKADNGIRSIVNQNYQANTSDTATKETQEGSPNQLEKLTNKPQSKHGTDSEGEFEQPRQTQ